MSNDLISRSALLEELNEFCGQQRYLVPENVWDMIKKAPTAYDVDRVVEQLEDYLFKKYCVEGDGKIDEIIKAGGMNE